MAESHVISALKEKRARVAGELKAAQLRVMRLQADLACLDGSIRQFSHGYDPNTIRPKRTFQKNLAGLPKGAGSRSFAAVGGLSFPAISLSPTCLNDYESTGRALILFRYGPQRESVADARPGALAT